MAGHVDKMSATTNAVARLKILLSSSGLDTNQRGLDSLVCGRRLAGLELRVGSSGIQQSYYAIVELLGGGQPGAMPGPEIRTARGRSSASFFYCFVT